MVDTETTYTGVYQLHHQQPAVSLARRGEDAEAERPRKVPEAEASGSVAPPRLGVLHAMCRLYAMCCLYKPTVVASEPGSSPGRRRRFPLSGGNACRLLRVGYKQDTTTTTCYCMILQYDYDYFITIMYRVGVA